MLKIVHIPNPVLTTPTKNVGKIDAKIKTLVQEMIVTLDAQTDPEGVGLAATQVGVALNIFVMRPDKESDVTICINPKILDLQKHPDFTKKTKKKKHEPMEGCLSIPKFWSPVKRPQEVLLEYLTVDGEKKTEWFKDFEAVIVQHEVDHLQGILFPQRAVEQQSVIYEEKNGELHPVGF
jgi:peptide deformylase